MTRARFAILVTVSLIVVGALLEAGHWVIGLLLLAATPFVPLPKEG